MNAPAMRRRATLGVVLAGGMSRRFGADKALQRYRSERLVDRALRALRPLADGLLCVRSQPLEDLAADVRQLADRRPGTGPMQALQAAFEEGPAERYLIAACDMPLLNPGLYRLLLARLGSAPGICYRSRHGIEPLVSVFSGSAAQAVLAAGSRTVALRDWVVEHGFRILDVPGSEQGCFENVNTREALSRLSGKEHGSREVQR